MGFGRTSAIVAAIVVAGVVAGVLGAAPAFADHAPSLVVPGRPGIPVIINGYDASHTVVEGDWGLYRPGHVPPHIVGGPLIAPAPFQTGPYFPSQGRIPGYGRREIEPPNRGPQPAPGFYREWGAQSQELPASTEPPTPLIIAPTVETGRSRHRLMPKAERP